jgi:hypothetical protein
MVTNDALVREVRATRDRHAECFGCDLQWILAGTIRTEPAVR